MSKVTFRGGSSGYFSIRRVMKSDDLAEQLEKIAQPVFDAAFQDPNEVYTASLQMGRFYSDRVTIQIGAAPGIGDRVEAKRGTLARALGRIG